METHKLIVRTKENESNKSLLNKGLIPGIVWDFKKFKLASLNIIFNDRYIKKIDEKNKQIILTIG